jgi:cytochrome b6-f complex iron-sulfur subunit
VSDDKSDDKKKPQKNVSRRDFISKASVTAFAGAIGLGAAGLARAVMPAVLPDSSRQFKIGPPQDYPQGTVKNFEDMNVIVFRDDEGMWAISTVCTHLGCIAGYASDKKRFHCPCHGSMFAGDGKVTQGPAPRPLDWLEINVLPSGQLAVDSGKPVPLGTKYAV